MVSVGAGGGGRKADAAARWSGLYELLRLPGDSKAAAAARGLAALQLPPAAWGQRYCCCAAARQRWSWISGCLQPSDAAACREDKFQSLPSCLSHPPAPLTIIIHPSCFGQRDGGGLCVTRHGCARALPKRSEGCLWVPGEGEEGRCCCPVERPLPADADAR